MAVNIVQTSATDKDNFDVLEVFAIAGLNLRDNPLSIPFDEFLSLRNVILDGRGIIKRKGSDPYGSAMTGDLVSGLGHHESDSGITPLAMVGQTLYKYVDGDWAASDKTDYAADTNAVILRFNSKGGSVVDSGTTTSGSTSYLLEDTGKSWSLGQYAGFCVVIDGEIKYIADNTGTTLVLGEKLNSNTDSDYQSKSYEIFALSPHAFILNGVDTVNKYDLTTTTPINGDHVTDGKALPIASVGAVHQGRMWLATGTGDQNDRVFLTDVGVGENITTDTNLNINLQFFNDGDRIRNIGSMSLGNGSACVVAKQESVHVVEGENVLNYTTRSVIDREGCYAQKSFVTGRGTAFMLGKDGKVLSLTDLGEGPLSNPLPISLPIQSAIRAHTDAEQQNACATIYDNKYFLRVGNEMWYYDIEESLSQNRHVWVDISHGNGDLHFNTMAVIDETLYAGSSADGQVYKLLSTDYDGDEEIEMVINSGSFTLPGGRNFWVERVEIIADESDATVLSFQYAINGGDFSFVQSATLNNADSRYVFNVQKRCRSFKYRISESGQEPAAKISLPIRVFFRESDTGEDGTKG